MLTEIRVKNHKISEEHKKIIDENRPYKHFATFLEEGNFLFTPYKEMPRSMPHAILESHNGRVIAVSGCNSGYGGHGPNNTRVLLEYLGIPPKTACELIWYRSLQFSFDEYGNYDSNSLKAFNIFESNMSNIVHGRVALSSTVRLDIHNRNLYFTDITKDLHSIHNAIENIHASKMFLYYGENPEEYLNIDYVLDVKRFLVSGALNSKKDLQKSSFVKIISEEFTMICFVEKKYFKSFANQLTLYFTNKYYYHEVSLGGITVFSEDSEYAYNTPTGFWGTIRFAFKYIFRRKKNEVIREIYLPDKRGNYLCK
jgi:hypothetical protein